MNLLRVLPLFYFGISIFALIGLFVLFCLPANSDADYDMDRTTQLFFMAMPYKIVFTSVLGTSAVCGLDALLALARCCDHEERLETRMALPAWLLGILWCYFLELTTFFSVKWLAIDPRSPDLVQDILSQNIGWFLDFQTHHHCCGFSLNSTLPSACVSANGLQNQTFSDNSCERVVIDAVSTAFTEMAVVTVTICVFVWLAHFGTLLAVKLGRI